MLNPYQSPVIVEGEASQWPLPVESALHAAAGLCLYPLYAGVLMHALGWPRDVLAWYGAGSIGWCGIVAIAAWIIQGAV